MAFFSMFIGSFSKEPNAAIILGTFDSRNGEVNLISRYPTIRPSSLWVDEESDTLYCTQEVDSINDVNGGGVASFRLTNGQMIPLSTQSTNSACPCYVCKYDNHLYACNYAGGTLSEFITENGVIFPLTKHIRHCGNSIDKKRQAGPHVHYAALNPAHTILAVCDLGCDKIFLYPYSVLTGIGQDPWVINTPKGSGPRHLLFSQDGSFLYVITELSCSILVYSFDNAHRVNLIQTVSTRSCEKCSEQNWCGTLRFTPNQKGIVAANRGDDNLILYAVKEDGTLCPFSSVKTGLWPRDITFSPDGHWLLTANQNDDSLGIYEYAESPDEPYMLQHVKTVQLESEAKPSSIVFWPCK